MATDQAERPRFYQGQYLGPEDLSAAVDHTRWARGRHDLGAHAWGIAVGLGLREVPALDGGTEVYVEPGYAVDGFARPIVVSAAHPVSADALDALSVSPPPGESSVRVPIWLRYAEERTQEPPFGFAVCETDAQRSRIAETFEVLVGARTLAEQRDRIGVAGEEIDPAEALRTVNGEAPLLCDASVPFQTFPDDPDKWWLIPLGYVRWEPGSSGRILPATEADRRESRRMRRYLGVVAEGVLAADGLIRLRRRATDPPAGAVSTEAACDDPWPRAQSQLDLLYDGDSRRITPTELVWVEGDLRVAGDARLFGGRMEWRDEHGDGHGVPMWMRRVETNSFVDLAGNPVSGRDLQILIGNTADADGRNRLIIGAAPADAAAIPERVVIQNDGRVGIGTTDPSTFLAFPLTVRGIGEGEELLGFEDPAGNRTWHLNQNLGGSADGLNFVESGVADGRLFLQAGGNVGIATTEPQHTLQIGDSASPVSLSLRGPDLSTMSSELAFEDDLGLAGRWFRLTHDTQANRLTLRSAEADPIVSFQRTSGRVGIGTTAPGERLEVHGNVRLGAAGAFFGVGSIDNLRIVAGRVDPEGKEVSGTGYQAAWTGVGVCRIDFTTPFGAPPVVVASGFGSATGDDNLVTIASVQTDHVVIHTADVEHSFAASQNQGFRDTTAFTFVALGLPA